MPHFKPVLPLEISMHSGSICISTTVQNYRDLNFEIVNKLIGQNEIDVKLFISISHESFCNHMSLYNYELYYWHSPCLIAIMYLSYLYSLMW